MVGVFVCGEPLSVLLVRRSGGSNQVDGMADWLARSSGAVWAQDFTTDADVDNWRFSDNIGWDPDPEPDSLGSRVRRNPTEGILGLGALEIEQSTTENNNSYWWRMFNPAIEHWQFDEAGGGRGPGQRFYVQLRVKGTHFGTGTGGGRKIWEVGRNQSSSPLQKLVWEDTGFRGIFQMYQGTNGVDSNAGLYVPVGGDFNYQPGSAYAEAPGYCSYDQMNLDNFANCWMLENNQWGCYYFDILPATDGETDGHITAKGWKPGMPGYVTIMDRDLYMEYEPTLPFDFNAMACWVYETTGTSGIAVKQHFDQIIYSHSPIACPMV